MAEVRRISAREARRRAQSGATLLVCAYDDDAKCRKAHLDGAIAMSELRPRLPSLRKDQGIVLYCA
jgi:hypothetical protein